MLIFFWLPSQLVKIDASTIEVNMATHFKDMNNKSQWQSSVSLHKPTLLPSKYTEEKHFIFFLSRNTKIDNLNRQ